MRASPGQGSFGNRRGDFLPLDLEADWSYLRANLDQPVNRFGNRLGSGLVAWLTRHMHGSASPAPQLSILARIQLGPRQTLALVEAEGVHVLVGTSTDGPPSFFSLDYDSGRKADRPPEREGAVLSGAIANAAKSGRREATAIGAVSHPALLSGSRISRSPRVTGRVSWV